MGAAGWVNIALLCIGHALLVLEAADIGGVSAAAVYVLALHVRLLAAAACSSPTLPSLFVRSPQRSAGPPTCGWRVSRRTKIVDARGAQIEIAGRRNRRNSQPPVAQAADRTRANLAHVRSATFPHLHPRRGPLQPGNWFGPFARRSRQFQECSAQLEPGELKVFPGNPVKAPPGANQVPEPIGRRL